MGEVSAVDVALGARLQRLNIIGRVAQGVQDGQHAPEGVVVAGQSFLDVTDGHDVLAVPDVAGPLAALLHHDECGLAHFNLPSQQQSRLPAGIRESDWQAGTNIEGAARQRLASASPT